MNYWLDLFTGTTWQEFRKAGANISGFREGMRPNAPGKSRRRIPLLPDGRHALGRRIGSDRTEH